MILRAIGMAALGCLLAFAPARAQPTDIFFSGFQSERLQTFYLAEKLRLGAEDPVTRARLVQLLRQQGFTQEWKAEGKPFALSTSGFLFPVLEYDPNINGGFANDSFSLGGFTFTLDPELVGRAGFVAGAGAAGYLRALYGRGRFLDGTLRASIGAAPAEDGLQVRRIGGELCSRNHVDDWKFVDLCGRYERADRDLTEFEEVQGDLSGTHLFAVGDQRHEARLTLRRVAGDAFGQTQAGGTLTSLWAPRFATTIFGGVGAAVPGHMAMSREARVAATTVLYDRPVQLSVGYQRANGGTFFGQAREEDIWSTSISVPINDDLAVSVGYQQTRSTVDLFARQGPFLTLSLPRWRF
ncbi:hypothetical protein [Oceanomicrobium pacificus]|uniref:Uncharacterized protein n=1 Tax=Oceanomicrobium pacificus TaxID=2692916 RepID=A0A6B0TYB4_9RHOB|nr:hypothetical protein [Oceanomicrobium pacificus]MXU66695.1 hypothetical protein [Oceanomicrobium pacificus]